jgi:F5/8 type C domain
MATDRREFLLRTAQLGALSHINTVSILGFPLALSPAIQNRGVEAPNPLLPPSAEERKEIFEHDSPGIEEYASVEAVSQGYPVYGFDYMMYIYGVSPDFFPANVLQEGNRKIRVKIPLKKSWEIKNNLLGSNTAQVPRTRKNDSHPTLPIHLIDGDPSTVWCSFGCLAPDVHPEWIRIDLPIEASVQSIALVCGNEFYPNSNFGRALPKDLEVKVSTDAWHWDTVYSNKDVDTKVEGRLEIKAAPREAGVDHGK